jgi:hypothetical protein
MKISDLNSTFRKRNPARREAGFDNLAYEEVERDSS